MLQPVECKKIPVLEVDELRSFIFRSKEKVRVWIAMSRETREIVASACGDRSENTCRILWDHVPPAYKETIVFSDYWSAYQAVIPNEQHRPVGKETGETAHIERWNNTLRQHLARFVRKTLSLNMIDRLDGLAASLVLIASIALVIIAWSGGNAWGITVLGLLSVAILAFLGFNLRLGRRALVFMGDAGSLFLGFALLWFLVDLSQGEQRSMVPVTALWLFAVPLIDTVSIMGHRVLLGCSPFLADQEHFHHILLAARFSPKRALVLILLIGLAAACVGLVGHFLGISEHWMFLGFLFLFALHFWILVRAWRTRHFFRETAGAE